MRIASLILLSGCLAACGSSDGEEDGPSAPPAGEIQALANAEAMLNSREDVSADQEELTEPAPEEAQER